MVVKKGEGDDAVDVLVEGKEKRRKSSVVLEVCGLLYKKEGGRKEVEWQRRWEVFLAARQPESWSVLTASEVT